MLYFTKERWNLLANRLSLSIGERAFEQIQGHYSVSWRAYHNVRHIEDCLEQLDRSPRIAEQPDEVELAIWLHDVIYDTHRSDNEDQSAAFAASILQDVRAAPDVVQRVTANILATTHNATATRIDEQLIADIDLSILGRPMDEYDVFETAIRKEYQWVPWATYRDKRTEVLQSFLDRESIYRIDWFAEKFEASALDNLNVQFVSSPHKREWMA